MGYAKWQYEFGSDDSGSGVEDEIWEDDSGEQEH